MNKIFTLGMVFGAVACLVGAIFTGSAPTPAYANSSVTQEPLPMLVVDSSVTVGEITQVVPELAPVMVTGDVIHKQKGVKVVIGESVMKKCYDYGMYSGGGARSRGARPGAVRLTLPCEQRGHEWTAADEARSARPARRRPLWPDVPSRP
jgi:hypothetical protein